MSEFSAISLFSGAGGLDLGLMDDVWTIRLAVDKDHDAVQTYRRNFPSVNTVCADLIDFSAGDLRSLAGLSTKESLDLLIAGPPCTPYSKSGNWLPSKRRGLDPNQGLVGVFGYHVAALRPRWFVMENVPGLASPRSPYRSIYRRLVEELGSRGYGIEVAIVSALDAGVAQARRRLFMIGERRSQPYGSGPTLTLPPPETLLTAGVALAGLPDIPEPEERLSGRWAHLIPEVPPGENYLYFTAKRGYPHPLFEWRSRYWNFLLKLDPQRPSPVIQARPGPSTGPFHWDNRRLRMSELKRLFGYPDGFEFVGTRSSMQRQIGNSVPPPLARALFERLVEGSSRLF